MENEQAQQLYFPVWSDKAVLPKVISANAPIHTPTHREAVGFIGGDGVIRSNFISDVVREDDSAPMLEALTRTGFAEVQEQAVNFHGEETVLPIIVTTLRVCRQCGVSFSHPSANKLYCPECTEMRRKRSSTLLWEQRAAKKKTSRVGKKKGGAGFEILSGQTINDIFVDGPVEENGLETVYRCECKRCGSFFTAVHSVIATNTIRCCPVCMNKEAGIDQDDIRLEDADVTSCQTLKGENCFRRNMRSGFLAVREQINARLILCNCGCGKRLVAEKEAVLSGEIESCGCYHRGADDILFLKAKHPLIGKKVDKVTCIGITSRERPARFGYTEPYLYCQCECGRKFLELKYSFMLAESRGSKMDCGCGIGMSRVRMERGASAEKRYDTMRQYWRQAITIEEDETKSFAEIYLKNREEKNGQDCTRF